MSGADPAAPSDNDGEDPADVDGGEEADGSRLRPKKSPNAFRTISEVADDLHIPQHVLRFWETKFPQVKPLKRGGGRRYYRPDDIALLRRISGLLYVQGYTIKGVQRLLREGGGKLSDDIPPPSMDDLAEPDAEPPDHPANAPGAPQMTMPGLTSAAPRAHPRAAVPGTDDPGGLPSGDSRPDPEAELRQLRILLSTTLQELEALRALLP